MTINQIYRQDAPGVVDITVTGPEQRQLGLFGGSQQTQGEGAGVVYDTKGDILTDEHVVANATSVTVTFENGEQGSGQGARHRPVDRRRRDPRQLPSSELHPITFASSSAAQVGDPVVAIGSPFSLPETVTAGDRQRRRAEYHRARTTSRSLAQSRPTQRSTPATPAARCSTATATCSGLNDQIQTNSGSSAGVGFAIPSNMVARIANEIIAGKKIQHAYVGVFLNAAPPAALRSASRRAGSPPAAQAGLRPQTSSPRSTEDDHLDPAVHRDGRHVLARSDDHADGQARRATKTLKLTLGTRPPAQPAVLPRG